MDIDDFETRVMATQATLSRIAAEFAPAALASSLAAEDMVLTDMIVRGDLPIAIFTLETGRLHRETLEMVERIDAVYGYRIALYRPQAEAVDAYVREHGLNAFYDSIELRRECCRIRKVEPLRRVLAGRSAWITGQRREQAVTRGELPLDEPDSVFGLHKYNPLALWTQDEVWAAIRALDIPYNPLHDRGYP
ncbi:MAG: phosphoadenylyl-sulfate reductase, partial [Burkholderiaceae bacterium]